MSELLGAHTLSQVNHVPEGFANNLIWNAAHCYVSLHLLVFALNDATTEEMAALGYRAPSRELVDAYRKGTRPTGPVDEGFVAEVRTWLVDFAWVDELDEAFLSPGRYRAYDTSWGVRLDSAAEAIAYINMHEGMHLGVMLSQRKLV